MTPTAFLTWALSQHTPHPVKPVQPQGHPRPSDVKPIPLQKWFVFAAPLTWSNLPPFSPMAGSLLRILLCCVPSQRNHPNLALSDLSPSLLMTPRAVLCVFLLPVHLPPPWKPGCRVCTGTSSTHLLRGLEIMSARISPSESGEGGLSLGKQD